MYTKKEEVYKYLESLNIKYKKIEKNGKKRRLHKCVRNTKGCA